MVLVLDHLPKDDGSGSLLIQPQREAANTEPDLVLSHCQRSDSSASDRSTSSEPTRSNMDPVSSEKGLDSTYRERLNSGASDRSQSPFQRSRLNSGASDQSVSSQSCFRERAGSDVSESNNRPRFDSGASDSIISLSRKRTNSGTSDHSVCISSEERVQAEGLEVAMTVSSSSIDSEAQGKSLQAHPKEDHITDQEQPDGGVLSRRESADDLLNGSENGKINLQKPKVSFYHNRRIHYIFFLFGNKR